MSIINEIAQQSGVSVATVSHILGNRRDLHRKSTQQLVLSVANELGYRPSSSAIAIKSGRFHCVTLLVSTDVHRSIHLENMLGGIIGVLEPKGYHLNLIQMSDEKLNEAVGLPKFLTQWMTDGVLVNYTHFIPQWLVDRIHEDRAPAVWINSKNEIESVRPDDFKAGYDATKQLIELGHTRIAYAVHYTEHYSAVERGDGYVAAMSEAGLRPRWELHAQERGLEGPAWVSIASEWFRSPDRPTAIIAYGAIPGLSVAYAAEKSQLRIPEDLSIVMFDDDQVQNRSTGKRFSTWRVPQHEVADEATRMLLQMIEDPDRPVEPISVPFEKLEDCSTARPLSRLNGT